MLARRRGEDQPERVGADFVLGSGLLYAGGEFLGERVAIRSGRERADDQRGDQVDGGYYRPTAQPLAVNAVPRRLPRPLTRR